jgi:hypothetical protein
MNGGMKVAAAAVVVILAAAVASSAVWARLGERDVADTVELDSFELIASEDVVTAIKLKIERRSVHVLSLTIHFADGTKQEATLDEAVSAGTESRVIEFEGDRGRLIAKVDVAYKPLARRKTQVAHVVLLGRR